MAQVDHFLQVAHRGVDKSQQAAHPATPGLLLNPRSLNPLFMTRVHPQPQGEKRKEKAKQRKAKQRKRKDDALILAQAVLQKLTKEKNLLQTNKLFVQ